jgi:hypothetical protein
VSLEEGGNGRRGDVLALLHLAHGLVPALLPCEHLALLGAVQCCRAAATLAESILCIDFVALEELVSQSRSKALVHTSTLLYVAALPFTVTACITTKCVAHELGQRVCAGTLNCLESDYT